MPVRYIGRQGDYKGTFLFKILCNLKGFGVGRMVIRKSYADRYPESCYYIIKSARPDLTSPVSVMCPVLESHNSVFGSCL